MPFQPSPFPGMDPYIEARWGNAHARLIASAADALAPQLADDLTADVEERVVIDDTGVDEADRDGDDDVDEAAQTRLPDVRVIGHPAAGWDQSRPAVGGAALAEPMLLAKPGPVAERSIRIVDVTGNRLVTTIEFLSPRNKLAAGGGRATYLRKRRELMASDANLVEVDLVRAGNWSAMVRPYNVPRSARTPYRATVARAHPPGGPMGLYPIDLRQRLPVIRVPLRAGEPDVTLDLQSLVDAVYRSGRYDRTDYAAACDPPLTGPDADWADGLLRAAGRRG